MNKQGVTFSHPDVHVIGVQLTDARSKQQTALTEAVMIPIKQLLHSPCLVALQVSIDMYGDDMTHLHEFVALIG